MLNFNPLFEIFLLLAKTQGRMDTLIDTGIRKDQDAAQSQRVSLAYRRLANAMILSTLREISKNEEEISEDQLEISFVESRRIDPWCELAGLEPEVVRRAARKLINGARSIEF